jgi:hypothetical protein
MWFCRNCYFGSSPRLLRDCALLHAGYVASECICHPSTMNSSLEKINRSAPKRHPTRSNPNQYGFPFLKAAFTNGSTIGLCAVRILIFYISKTLTRAHSECFNFGCRYFLKYHFVGRLDDMVSNFDTGSWSACGPLMVHVMDALWTEGGQLENRWCFLSEVYLEIVNWNSNFNKFASCLTSLRICNTST